MFKWLVKHFVKNSNHIESVRVREDYATLCSLMGVFLNLFLFATKMIAGMISHSITIISDAFNNLGDSVTTLVSILGFKMASFGAGKHHPFGHGRIEWIMGLFTSISVIFMGFELVRSSIHEIIHPTETEFNLVIAIILLISIIIKIYMYFYNHTIGLKINATTLLASASDALSDSIATSAVLLASLIAYYTGWKIDGWSGTLVSCLIIYAGFGALTDIIGRIVGKAPDEAMLHEIDEAVKKYPVIKGYYDLLVSDYGFGRYGINLRIVGEAEHKAEIHRAGEELSYELYKKYGSDSIVQSEVLSYDQKKSRELLGLIRDYLQDSEYPVTSVDSFRIIQSEGLEFVYFDLIIPCSIEQEIEEQLKKNLGQVILSFNPDYRIIIHPKIINAHRAINEYRRQHKG